MLKRSQHEVSPVARGNSSNLKRTAGSYLYPCTDLCYKPNISEDFHPRLQDQPLDSATHSAELLHVAIERQEERFAGAFEVLRGAIRQRVFPGCAVAVTDRGTLVAWRGLGHFTYESNSPEVVADTVFDLASVTKVLATSAMAMILYERGLLDLEMPVVSAVPEFAGDDERRRDVTVRMLLAHSSGLPAYEKLFLSARTRDELLRASYSMALVADPGSRAEYSDIGFLVLGVALERLADEALDRFCQREGYGPLGMSRTTFNPPVAGRGEIPPTVDDRTFRHRVAQGEVNDENASVLGGVAGHAGLFAPARDVAMFAQVMLNGGRPILRPETVALFTKREVSPPGTSRALGWDTPSQPSQSGKYFSSAAFGHLGYTGTSLWIDPQQQFSVTLLTNRTWPNSTNQVIKQIRPLFHDAVFEALERTS
jgi:CubicO group peptidase (beta-lactamase class C family)